MNFKQLLLTSIFITSSNVANVVIDPAKITIFEKSSDEKERSSFTIEHSFSFDLHQEPVIKKHDNNSVIFRLLKKTNENAVIEVTIKQGDETIVQPILVARWNEKAMVSLGEKGTNKESKLTIELTANKIN